MIPADILVLRVPDGCGHGDADGVHKGLQATVVPAHLQLVAVEVGTAHLQLVAVEVGTQVPGPTRTLTRLSRRVARSEDHTLG